MIIVYEGTPGSGKTYDACNRIKDNLRLGRVVYTNVEGMNLPECKRALQDLSGLNDFDFAKNFHILSDDQVREFWKHITPGSMVVLDEIHKIFNARDWQSENNRACADWASTHRHYGIDLYLITQRIEKIDSQVRTLVEWTYRYRKLNFLGSLFQRGYIRTTYLGEDRTEKYKTETLRYDPRVFRTYQSYVAADIKELGTERQPNLFRHPIFYAIPVVLLFILWMGSKSSIATGSLFASDKISARLSATNTETNIPEPPLSSLLSYRDKVPSIPIPSEAPAAGSVAYAPPAAGLAGPLSVPAPRRLVAVVGGKKIYRCGDQQCAD